MVAITGLEALRRSLAEDCAHRHALEARIARQLAAVEATEAWIGSGIRSIEHWASMALGLAPETTRTLLAVGRKLPVLPAIDAALGEGRLSIDKVKAVAPVATPASEAHWLDIADRTNVTQLRRIVSAWRRVDPDGNAEEPPDGRPRRGLWWRERGDGLAQLTALLAPEDAAIVQAALANATEAAWREMPADDRTADPLAARAADALVAIAETAMAAGPTPVEGGERNTVNLIVDVEVLAGTRTDGVCRLEPSAGPLPLADARTLACDATIRPLLHRNGTPIDVGRDRRLVTRAQRRALKARDGGCAFPGCEHTRFVDAHHIDHWIEGGATDLANLVLLCRHHHRAHHRGAYLIQTTSTPGHFQFVDPATGQTIDAERRRPPPPDPAALPERTGITPTWVTPHAKDCRGVHLPSTISDLLDAACAVPS